MNREIEYRAKDSDGNWVYGYYASGVYGCGGKVHYIVSDLTHIMSSCWGVDAIEIDPDTLGQYTGIKDKNGSGLAKVYEGDIISIDGTLKGNIYENDKEPTDIIIPQLGTKAWVYAYKEAVERGYGYSE